MRLIDADDVLKHIDDDCNCLDYYDEESWIAGLCDAVACIQGAPTIEVEPNSCEYWDSESNFCALRRPQAEPKHGHWIDTGHGCKCSVCETPYRWNEADTMKFCKECGAKMDEVEE